MYKLEDKSIKFYGEVNFTELPLLGWGSHGEVYKIKIDEKEYALKVFNQIYTEYLRDYEKIMEIKLDSFISPLKILYINDKFSGYLMKLCKGDNLFDRKLNISPNTFINSSRKLFKDTYSLSQLGYSISDLYSANIMYDKGFKMIDMDDYKKIYNDSFENILKLNNKRINALLFNIFIKSSDSENLFVKDSYLNKLRNDCILGKTTFEEFFVTIFELANNMSNKEISRISTIGKVLKKNIRI